MHRRALRSLATARTMASAPCFHGKSLSPSYMAKYANRDPPLPPLPLPALSQSLGSFVRHVKVLISDAEHEDVRAAAAELLMNEGPELQKELEAMANRGDGTSFIERYWFDAYLLGRAPIMVNEVPFIHFRNEDTATPPEGSAHVQCDRAARLLSGLDDFITSLDNGSYPVPDHCAVPYTRLFRTVRIPGAERDTIATHEHANHIVVMYAGSVWSVERSVWSNASACRSALESIIRSAATREAGSGIGVLTSQSRDVWAAGRQRLLEHHDNAKSLEKVESALFVVCLDGPGGTDLSDVCRSFLGATAEVAHDRWYDKSCLLVDRRGRAAVLMEHSVVDGMPMLAAMECMYEKSLALCGDTGRTAAEAAQAPVEHVPFVVDRTVEELLAAAQASHKELCRSVSICAKRLEIGKKDIVKRGISPDAFLQTAYQLAARRLFGKPVQTYESISTASFSHGRTDAVRPLTSPMDEFVRAFLAKDRPQPALRDMLDQAGRVHRKMCSNWKEGRGFDRHLYALKCLAAEKGVPVPRLFTLPAYQQWSRDLMSTSQLGTGSKSTLFPGFGPVTDVGIGVGYGIHKDESYVHVTARHAAKAEQFASDVDLFAHQLLGLLDGSSARL